KAIEKYEYAIPHLKSIGPKDKRKVSYSFTKDAALRRVAGVYNSHNMHHHALDKVRHAISETPLEWREVTDYYSEILALARLGRFEEALDKTDMLIEMAETKKLANSQEGVNENFLARLLKLSVYTHRMAPGDKEQMRVLLSQLSELLPEIGLYNNDILIETVNLFSVAVNGTSNELRVAETQYFNTVSKSDFSPANWKVLAFHNFRRANEIQGDFVRALENERLSHQAQLELNAQHFETLGDLHSSGALIRDIEMVNLSQVKAEQERQRLALKAQQQQGIILILVAILLAITTIWFWQRQRIVTKLAGVDSLTGAMTRRSLYSWYANTNFSRSTSCAVLIDLDHFKLINDQHGHLTGDEVLTCFSNIVQDRIRKTDKLCRYGGEEFLLMLKDSKKEEAELLIDDIRERLKAHSKWNTTDASLVVNFSAGIVETNTHAKLEALIDQCDKLLYNAKSNGRAQTVVATFGS
ncbi:MAG: GGDEF domain-containing protein, partial [Pseudomonadota bacterium]|nr:GGDEF domain-containing protein [Pseudomonadota bacterium]